MRGNIYSRQKCFICGRNLTHDERRQGCFCKEHPEVSATGDFILVFGRDVRRESKSYRKLIKELNALRYQVDQDTYDPRDHQASKPLAFDKLILEYQVEKEFQKLKTIGNIKNYCRTSASYFGDANVKLVKKRHIGQFLRSLKGRSDKTKDNYLSNLRSFYKWLVDEEYLFHWQVPDFPKVEYELAWRTLTDWKTQDAILDEIHRISWKTNPKIWLGIDMLRTYPNIRPGDLLKLTEGDFDTNVGVVMVWRPTKRRNERKSIRLVPEHVQLIIALKKQFPAVGPVKFFRHHGGLQSVRPGQPFGNKYLYKWWIKACENLGVEGLDLYGGTRHTTTTELAKRYGREAAMDANENKTNKAFDRYCQMRGERAYEMALLVKNRNIDFPKTFPKPKKAHEKS
jgi:integrase